MTQPTRRWFIAGALALLSAGAYGQDEQDVSLLMRPKSDAGPTVVSVVMYVIDIGQIDGVSQGFDASVYVRLRWNDPRLAHDDEGRHRLALEDVWHPKILFFNQQSILWESLPEVVRVYQDGTVEFRQRYVGPFSQPLDLKDFPFDQHSFDLYFVSPGNSPEDIQFIPDPEWTEKGLHHAAGFSERLSLPDWGILRYEAGPRPLDVGLVGATSSGYALRFVARRRTMYYVWKILLPLVLIVMMAFSAFWIDPTNASSQISVATTSMLTLIAYRFLLDQLVPRLPYMTRMDYFILGSTILVFLTLVEVVTTSALARGGRKELARRMDRWSRVVFPLTFVALTLLSFLPALD